MLNNHCLYTPIISSERQKRKPFILNTKRFYKTFLNVYIIYAHTLMTMLCVWYCMTSLYIGLFRLSSNEPTSSLIDD